MQRGNGCRSETVCRALDLQLKVDRLKREEPQELAWCAIVIEEGSSSSHKVKCVIKKLQIQGQTRICIIQMQTGAARVLKNVRDESGVSYEVSCAAQIMKEARSKGWWICSHVDAAQIMAKKLIRPRKCGRSIHRYPKYGPCKEVMKSE